jgi:hypothetical protein
MKQSGISWDIALINTYLALCVNMSPQPLTSDIIWNGDDEAPFILCTIWGTES